MGFLCDRCSKCCRTHRVPITTDDLRRLQRFSGLSPEHIAELLPAEALDLEGEPECLLQLREGSRLLALRHEPSSSGETQCVFLSDTEGCTAHEARPQACRTYPFDRPERGSVGGAPGLGVVPHFMCPPETEVRATQEAESGDALQKSFQSDIQIRDSELAEYATWVQNFNARMRTRIRLGRLRVGGEKFLATLQDSGRLHPESAKTKD